MKYVLSAILLSLVALPCLAQRSTPVQLLHTSGAANDQFGFVVAVNGDTMIVGAYLDDVGANTDQGSAHIYRWTGTGWTLEATLIATGGAAGDQFGISVALSGDTALVGAYVDDVGANGDQGSAYIFTRTGTTWSQQAQLTANNGAASDNFGISVALSGDTAIVGAYADDVGANGDQGSAYIFTRTGTTWTQQAQLIATGGAGGDSFGVSVALSGDTAIVGATGDDVGANTNQGTAYVFTRSATTWTQQAQLIATGGAGADNFGISVALSDDTAIVGAFNDTVGANTNQGSAYIFTRSGSTWTQQAQLTAASGAVADLFGVSVAISGDTVLVGAYGDNVGSNNNQGSAHVFTRSGTIWTQQAQLTAAGGAAGDQFGISVALSGDTAIVGAFTDDVGANPNQGSAWVFSRIGSTWIGPDLQALATAGATNDQFGVSVAISGDTAIVGARSDDVGANTDQGSAYIFTRSGTTWTQQAQLTATGGAAGDEFGRSVALSGDTAIVGAWFDNVGANADQGSAYIFTRSPGGTTWTQQAQLTATGGAAEDYFGYSVAISGDTAIVGAFRDDVGGNSNQGSAYAFTRSGTTWTQQAQLTATGGAASDRFGVSVALSGDTAIVGAMSDDVGANTDQGSAYVFTRSGTTWTQQAQLTATDGAAFDEFGISVALSGDTAIVGATGDDVGANTNQGSAYIFTRTGTTWTQQAQLIATGGAAGDLFGYSVALSGDTAIVGATGDDVGANTNQGTAYVFTRSGSTWTQQAQLTATGGAANDSFGISVALSGDTAIVGAQFDDVGANTDQGSAWFFDVPAADFFLARNDVTGVSYSTLAAALAPAVSGQQITANEAAWRTSSSIDTAGRSLSLRGSGDIRTPSTCAVTLGGSSILATPPQNSMDIFGSLSVPASQLATVSSGSFRLGSRGQLRLFSNAQLTIDAPLAVIDAPTQIDARAELNFRGNATVYGDVAAALYSDVSAIGSLTNFGSWSVTSGSIGATLYTNRASLSVLGTSGIFGDFTNAGAATTTITSGRLFVVGTLTNNGTISGAVCSNCVGSPPALEADGGLQLGAAANFSMPFDGALVRVGGSVNNAINSNTRYNLSLATLRLEGTGAEQTLEAMSKDVGANAAGLDRTLAGHYPIGTLEVGPASSTVRLVDSNDNDGLGQSNCEAIYVNTLRIHAGSRLINTGCSKIYYTTLINNGIIDVPANVIPLAAACPGDLNSDGFVDDADFSIFVVQYDILDCEDPSMPADCPADINGDQFVDDLDFQVFVVAYNELLCP